MWINQLIHDLVIKNAAIDDTNSSDLDDLVSLRGTQTSGFGIKDHKSQLVQRDLAEFFPARLFERSNS